MSAQRSPAARRRRRPARRPRRRRPAARPRGAGASRALQPPAARRPPTPRRGSSAPRARSRTCSSIAAETHVAGSDADARVVDDLVATLTGLGLDTRVQNAVGATDSGPGDDRDGPGPQRRRASCRAPTRPAGCSSWRTTTPWRPVPARADDAAGVATLLESVRALTAGAQLRNDVVVVLTDAEEACLCGAEAFAGLASLAGDGGVVLNFEARGTDRPTDHVRDLAGQRRPRRGLCRGRSAPRGHQLRGRGLPGAAERHRLQRAARRRRLHRAQHRLHRRRGRRTTPRRTPPERTGPGTLQALGDNALALARELGDRDLGAAGRARRRRRHVLPGARPAGALPGPLVWPLAAAALLAGRPPRRWSPRRRGIELAADGRRPPPRWPSCRSCSPRWPRRACGRCWWRSARATRRCSTRGGPAGSGWPPSPCVAAVGAALVRAAPPPGRCRSRSAIGALVWLAALGAVLAARTRRAARTWPRWPALAGAVTGHRRRRSARDRVRAAGRRAGRRGGRRRGAGAHRGAVLPRARPGAARGAGRRRDAAARRPLPAFELLFPDETPARVAGSTAPSCPVAAVGRWPPPAPSSGCRSTGSTPQHPVPSQLAYALDSDTRPGVVGQHGERPRRVHGAATSARRGRCRRLPLPGRPGVRDRRRRSRPACPRPRSTHAVRRGASVDSGEITVSVTPQRPGVRLSPWTSAWTAARWRAPAGRPRRPRGGARGATGCA